jgi:hypothetical protein
MRTMSVVLLTALALNGCTSGKDDTVETCSGPKANAGENVALALGGSTTLDASTSELCPGTDAQVVYTWAIEQAPVTSSADDTIFGASNGSSDAKTVPFTPDVVGSYVISLVVSDGENSSQPDVIVITVNSDDADPIADAGADVSTKVGQRAVLDGTGSSDPEGAPLEYLWTLVESPSCSDLGATDVYDSHAATASLVPDCAGTFTVALIVSDGAHYSPPDYVNINAGDTNTTPYADAGSSTTLAACASNTLTLNGYGSYDPDGDSLSYRWWLNSAPPDSAVDDDSFDDPTKPNPRFNWDVVGTYTFSLQVTDGVNESAIDEVTYTMVNQSLNKSPIANAGADQTLEAKADCTVASYVADCDDCEAEEFELDGSASSDPDGDQLSFFWTETTVGSTVGPLDIIAPTAGFTLVRTPVMPAILTTGNKATFDLKLSVSDCTKSDDDTVKLTFTCTGKKI